MNKSSKKTKQRYSYYSRTQEKLMSNLYQEAIADARALREMAERNAKNKIIEAITPKIRNMIERQIMMEAEGETEEEVPNLDLDALPDPVRVEDVDLDDALGNDLDVDIEALAASVGASTAAVDIVLDDVDDMANARGAVAE